MKSHKALVEMALCAVFAAILCICSPISVPVGPVPVSLQVFAVLLCAVTLNLRPALISVAVYLGLGLFLPLFSGGNTGLAALPGPTGGYIWSFVLMVPLVRLLASLGKDRGWTAYAAAFGGCVVAVALCYLCGTVQFSLVTNNSFAHSLRLCVIPFILPDLAKSLAATVLGVALRGILKKQQLL